MELLISPPGFPSYEYAYHIQQICMYVCMYVCIYA